MAFRLSKRLDTESGLRSERIQSLERTQISHNTDYESSRSCIRLMKNKTIYRGRKIWVSFATSSLICLHSPFDYIVEGDDAIPIYTHTSSPLLGCTREETRSERSLFQLDKSENISVSSCRSRKNYSLVLYLQNNEIRRCFKIYGLLGGNGFFKYLTTEGACMNRTMFSIFVGSFWGTSRTFLPKTTESELLTEKNPPWIATARSHLKEFKRHEIV